MSIAILYAAESTHQLLYRLLASEMGWLRAISPDNQALALVEVFPQLQRNAAAGGAGSFTMDFSLPNGTKVSTATVSGLDEAERFVALYRGINAFQRNGIELADQLHKAVYPHVGRMVHGNPQIYAGVLAQLKLLYGTRSPAARDGMLERLYGFGLGSMAEQLRAEGPPHPLLCADFTSTAANIAWCRVSDALMADGTHLKLAEKAMTVFRDGLVHGGLERADTEVALPPRSGEFQSCYGQLLWLAGASCEVPALVDAVAKVLITCRFASAFDGGELFAVELQVACAEVSLLGCTDSWADVARKLIEQLAEQLRPGGANLVALSEQAIQTAGHVLTIQPTPAWLAARQEALAT